MGSSPSPGHRRPCGTPDHRRGGPVRRGRPAVQAVGLRFGFGAAASSHVVLFHVGQCVAACRPRRRLLWRSSGRVVRQWTGAKVTFHQGDGGHRDGSRDRNVSSSVRSPGWLHAPSGGPIQMGSGWRPARRPTRSRWDSPVVAPYCLGSGWRSRPGPSSGGDPPILTGCSGWTSAGPAFVDTPMVAGALQSRPASWTAEDHALRILRFRRRGDRGATRASWRRRGNLSM